MKVQFRNIRLKQLKADASTDAKADAGSGEKKKIALIAGTPATATERTNIGLAACCWPRRSTPAACPSKPRFTPAAGPRTPAC